MSNSTLYCGDCLAILPTLPAQSVDAIIADPPYGTTACKWDSVIPLEAMWRELKRVVKPRGAIVLFGAQPFTSELVCSNQTDFRYEWIWEKSKPTGFLMANHRPMKAHENIIVFSLLPATNSNSSMAYYPQGLTYSDKPFYRKRRAKFDTTTSGGPFKSEYNAHSTDYPCSILPIHETDKGRQHPTQKPVDLLRYLVRTYTNPDEVVLDFTMGSGTTGVACAMEGRHFIGVELDAGYYDIARKRIESVQPALMEAAD